MLLVNEPKIHHELRMDYVFKNRANRTMCAAPFSDVPTLSNQTLFCLHVSHRHHDARGILFAPFILIGFSPFALPVSLFSYPYIHIPNPKVSHCMFRE
jgi:hypothetical protein